LPFYVLAFFTASFAATDFAQAVEPVSHPPLRSTQPVKGRKSNPITELIVDGKSGDDSNAGSLVKPLRTIGEAIRRAQPQMTITLRAGVYRDPVYVAARGMFKAPITLRSFPGESAILDGSLAEFFDDPTSAWEPVPDGAKGEFRSTRPYPNLRNIVGSFGDSMIGLNTYFYLSDLRATNETIRWPGGMRDDGEDILPLSCGPGIFYDAMSGHIHVRLSHTHLPAAKLDGESGIATPLPNYTGETDPRKVPLILAPFRSTPLVIDGARHVRFSDLTIRGGGYDAVRIEQSQHVEFDNVTIWCGTYGIRASGSGPLKLYRCGLYGNCPPWLFRGDTSKRAYPGRPLRDITRLNTHASLVIDAGREFSVFAHPMNDHWEISHCEFTDSHDGPYLGGINLSFHHNLIENTQDDGIYLSQMYPRHLYMGSGAEVKVFENAFRGCLTAIAFGGTEDTRDRVFIYRNLFDLRSPILTGRPTETRPAPGIAFGKPLGDHGSPPWPEMTIYHNTFIAKAPARKAAMGTLGHVKPEHPRRVFNNLFLHLARLPGFVPPSAELPVEADGNLYWSPGTNKATAEGLFRRYRSSPGYQTAKEKRPLGVSDRSIVADPGFVDEALADTNLQPIPADGGSVTKAGVELPAEWPDSRPRVEKPDIGSGREWIAVGR
jgi:hypothetical protein